MWRPSLFILCLLLVGGPGRLQAMSPEEYEQNKTTVLEKYIPWAESGIGGSANKTIAVTVDWNGFDQLAPAEGVEAIDKLMDQIRTVGPIIRGLLIAESFEQRQLVRTRVDGLRFEHAADAQQSVVTNDGNTLVIRVLAGREAATRDELWAAADVLNAMPESPAVVAEETPFDYWKINVTSLVLPELQGKLSELSAKELTIDVDWGGFSGYESADDPEEIAKQFQELVRRVQFTIRGMLFTGGDEERELVRARVDRVLFGHATDENQPVLTSDGNTLIFLLSKDGEPIEKDYLFFNLPEVVKAMPVSPNPVE